MNIAVVKVNCFLCSDHPVQLDYWLRRQSPCRFHPWVSSMEFVSIYVWSIDRQPWMNPTSSEMLTLDSTYLLGPRLLALYMPSKSSSTEPRYQCMLCETQSHGEALPLSDAWSLYIQLLVFGFIFLILELNRIEAAWAHLEFGCMLALLLIAKRHFQHQ